MEYAERLEQVTVLGAAGKMGSGILMLTAMEMLRQKLRQGNREKNFTLYAMDTSPQGLDGLMRYVKDQALKYAEKNIRAVRQLYAFDKTLIDNEEIIRQYIADLISLIRTGTRPEPATDSRIIFEAVSERPDLKIELMLNINRNSKLQPWFFTNTSAIPISLLDDQAGLRGRIMGVHFYNPPLVQALVETVRTETTHPGLTYFVGEFLKNIGKIAVPAYDVVGFIGNGYFMRDILFAENMMKNLQNRLSYTQSLYVVNKVTQDLLIRPMGIFQLIDYVGIDVVQYIMSVMNTYTKNEDLHSPLVDSMMDLGLKGGQNHDGSQKDGFFSYEKGKIKGVYDVRKKRYVPVDDLEEWTNDYLGDLPPSWIPWKQMVQNPDKNMLLKKYFSDLKQQNSTGSGMALQYLQNFREIGQNLVKNKVAFKYDDVNTVLIKGFHHAYGPVNDFLA
jgi:3-hydroxyacyl-CoA dehydrogenase